MMVLLTRPCCRLFLWLLSATIAFSLVSTTCGTSMARAVILPRKLPKFRTNCSGDRGMATGPELRERRDTAVTSTEDLIAEAHPDIEGEPRQIPTPAAVEIGASVEDGQNEHTAAKLVRHAYDADADRRPTTNIQEELNSTTSAPSAFPEQNIVSRITHTRKVDRTRSYGNSEWPEPEGHTDSVDAKHKLPLARIPFPLSEKERDEDHLVVPRLLQGEFLVNPSRNRLHRPDSDHQHLHRQRYNMFERLQHLQNSNEEQPRDGRDDATLIRERDGVLALIAKLKDRVETISKSLNARA